MFMELGDKGNVTQIVKKSGPFQEKLALTYGKSIANALAYLHATGLAHRRVVTDNIFITQNGIAKLGGLEFFMEVFDIEHNDDLTACWMHHAPSPFLAPELIEEAAHDPTAEDVFSWGVCVYYMLTGINPFVGLKGMTEMMQVINSKKWMEPKQAKGFNDKVTDLFKSVFQTEDKRIFSEELVKHPALM